jgi:Protein of unknown function (DUF3810)
MKYKKKWLFGGLLLILAIVIKWYSSSAQRVETGYAAGFYTGLAKVLRILFGWIPFSVGDLLYGFFVLWLIVKLVKGIKLLLQKKATWKGVGRRCIKTALLFLLLYVVFNGFWGINYNRQGIAYQLQLNVDSSNYDELKQITAVLIEKMNVTKQHLVINKVAYPSNKVLFDKVAAAYASAQKQFPFLSYKPVSMKPSLWGWLGNYTGFTGYYNPFTGEAQLNTTVPKFLQPFVACHEAAHQLGYAKENEANSVGFLAALHSGDSLLLYSTYFDLYNYASRQLYLQAFLQKDSLLIKDYRERLSPEVKADFKEMAAFYRRHRNPIEPVIRSGYGFYLKNNNQPQGIKTYDAVTAFVIAYYRKFGKI